MQSAIHISLRYPAPLTLRSTSVPPTVPEILNAAAAVPRNDAATIVVIMGGSGRTDDDIAVMDI